MSEFSVRFMRLMVFFDIPVKTKEQRRKATSFRNFLIKDGYHMIQFSVYGRLCKGIDSVNKHINRLFSIVPQIGNIRVMTVTEKQYASMVLIVGHRKKIEKISDEQLLLL